MRLFIAIELPEQIKAALVPVQEQLRRANLPVTWVAPQAMHLTLQFLGETDAAQLPQIAAAIDAAAQATQQSYTLRLDTLGAFPNERRPRIVWVGVGGATNALEQTQSTLATALEGLGFPGEAKPFHAHLTLGRVQRSATPEQQARLGTTLRACKPPPPLAWDVGQIVLFESDLRPSGPIYTQRHVSAFGRS